MTPIAVTWSRTPGEHCVPAVAVPLDLLGWPDAVQLILAQLARVPADKPLVIVVYGSDFNLLLGSLDDLAAKAERVWATVLAGRKPDRITLDVENARVPIDAVLACTLAPILKAAPGTPWSNFARREVGSANAPVLYGWHPLGETDQLKRLAANLALANAGDDVWLGDAHVADKAFVPWLPALYLHTIAKCGPGVFMLFDASKFEIESRLARHTWDTAVERYLAATGGRQWAGLLSVNVDTANRILTTTFRLGDGSTAAVNTIDLGTGGQMTSIKRLGKR